MGGSSTQARSLKSFCGQGIDVEKGLAPLAIESAIEYAKNCLITWPLRRESPESTSTDAKTTARSAIGKRRLKSNLSKIFIAKLPGIYFSLRELSRTLRSCPGPRAHPDIPSSWRRSSGRSFLIARSPEARHLSKNGFSVDLIFRQPGSCAATLRLTASVTL